MAIHESSKNRTIPTKKTQLTMNYFVTQITLQNTTIIKTINKTHLHKPTSVTESVKNQTSFSPILFLTRNP